MEAVNLDNIVDQHLFSDSQTLAKKLSEHVAAVLRKSVALHGKALLLVSGGSTPLAFFSHLSQQDLPWKSITVSLADERWVGSTHSDSNEKLVRENLLCNRASSATFLSLVSEQASPIEGESVINERLRHLIEDEGHSIDVLVLGMGEDGHTASLFPDADQLDEALNLTSSQYCKAITRHDLAHSRITLTAAFLLSAQNFILHIEGDKKLSVLSQALEQSSDNDKQPLPIAVILGAYGAPRDGGKKAELFFSAS